MDSQGIQSRNEYCLGIQSTGKVHAIHFSNCQTKLTITFASRPCKKHERSGSYVSERCAVRWAAVVQWYSLPRPAAVI